MLLQAIESTAGQSGNLASFIFIILLWMLIICGIIFILIKKIIKPMLNYFKTKQEYYQAQTEAIKRNKAE